MMERLKYHFERVCEDFGCRLIDMGGERDYVHPAISLLHAGVLHWRLSKNTLKNSRFVLISPT
jgi:hypothetical protein